MINKGHYIYKAIDHSGSIIYIGITNCIESRMAQHRLTSEWWKCFNKIHYALLENKKAAELLEVLMINEFRPKFNATHNREADLSLLSYNGAGLTWLDFDSFIKPKLLKTVKKKKSVVIHKEPCVYINHFFDALKMFNAKFINSDSGSFTFSVDPGFYDFTKDFNTGPLNFDRGGYANFISGWGVNGLSEETSMFHIFRFFSYHEFNFRFYSDLTDLLAIYIYYKLPFEDELRYISKQDGLLNPYYQEAAPCQTTP